MPTSPPKQEQREKQETTKEAKKADIDDVHVIPKIKSSHLNLDDVPVELLKTHQEKILKQVSFLLSL